LQAHRLLQHKTKRYDREGESVQDAGILRQKKVIGQEEIHAIKIIQEMKPLLMMRNALEGLALIRLSKSSSSSEALLMTFVECIRP
jgi:hypothetical protein